MWYKLIYLQNRSRFIDLENRLIVTKGERGVGVNKKWIDDKVLLYSIRNYIQNPVINHKEKTIKKEYIYNINVDITESLCYTAETNTTLQIKCKSIIIKKKRTSTKMFPNFHRHFWNSGLFFGTWTNNQLISLF